MPASLESKFSPWSHRAGNVGQCSLGRESRIMASLMPFQLKDLHGILADKHLNWSEWMFMLCVGSSWQLISTILMGMAVSKWLIYSQCIIFYHSSSLASSPSSRKEEQRSFSPDHKDPRDNNLCVDGSGAAATRCLHPCASQTATQKGKRQVSIMLQKYWFRNSCCNLLSLFNHISKVLVRKNNLFHRGDSQEVFDPPHYELFTLRDKVSLVSLINYYLFMFMFF